MKVKRCLLLRFISVSWLGSGHSEDLHGVSCVSIWLYMEWVVLASGLGF